MELNAIKRMLALVLISQPVRAQDIRTIVREGNFDKAETI